VAQDRVLTALEEDELHQITPGRTKVKSGCQDSMNRAAALSGHSRILAVLRQATSGTKVPPRGPKGLGTAERASGGRLLHRGDQLLRRRVGNHAGVA
jgi:hypothetical protein